MIFSILIFLVYCKPKTFLDSLNEIQVVKKIKKLEQQEEPRNCFENKVPCIKDGDCLTFCSHKTFQCENNACTPRKPADQLTCNIDNDGIYVLEGYNELGITKWSCFCLNTQYFYGQSCNKKNPFICQGGKLSPKGTCSCPSNKYLKYISNNNAYRPPVPVCVDSKVKNLFFI